MFRCVCWKRLRLWTPLMERNKLALGELLRQELQKQKVFFDVMKGIKHRATLNGPHCVSQLFQ